MSEPQIDVFGSRSKPAYYLAAFVVAFIAICTRRLDQILIAQFYAEDGTHFFAQAFASPLTSLFTPIASYLNLVPRLYALGISPLPWSLAPLLYSIAAAGTTAFVALRFLAARIPTGAALAGFAAVIAVPSNGEPFLNLCCLHFVLSLLIVIPFLESSPSRISAGAAMLAALSGPEVVVILPLIGIAVVFLHPTSIHRKLAVVIALCAVVQIAVMLSIPRASMAHVLPPIDLVRLYAVSLFAHPFELSVSAGWVVATIVVVALVALFVRNRFWLPAALLIATAVGYLVAARSVNIGWPNPMGNGARYTYAPLVLLVVAIGWLASQSGSRRWRWAPASVLLAGLLFTSMSEWAGRVPPNYHWRDQVAEAHHGTREIFQIPGPEMWEFPVPVRRSNANRGD